MAAEDYIDLCYDEGSYFDEGGPHSDECEAGGHPVIRINRQTGEKFLGCSAFPKCRWTCSGGYPFNDAPAAEGEPT